MQKFYFNFLFFLLCGFTLNAQTLIIDMEGGALDCQYGPTGVGAAIKPIVTLENNPDATGINTSATSIRYEEPVGSAGWQELQMFFDGSTTTTGFTLNNGTTVEEVIRFMVYSENETTFDIRLQLNNFSTGSFAEQMSATQTVTTALNTWTEVEYSFIGNPRTTEFTPNVRLWIKPGVTGDGDVYYIDKFLKAATVLPVDLVSFDAKQQKEAINLNWQTATELNNEGFAVEHSADGRNFEKLDFINGSGTTYDYQDYSFSHKSPAVGKNYYRLKQIDFDGAFSISEVLTVELHKENELSIQPTLADDFIQFNYQSDANTEVTIFNQTGQIVTVQTITAGTNSTRLDIKELPEGLYFLNANTGSQNETVKFVKK